MKNTETVKTLKQIEDIASDYLNNVPEGYCPAMEKILKLVNSIND